MSELPQDVQDRLEAYEKTKEFKEEVFHILDAIKSLAAAGFWEGVPDMYHMAMAVEVTRYKTILKELNGATPEDWRVFSAFELMEFVVDAHGDKEVHDLRPSWNITLSAGDYYDC